MEVVINPEIQQKKKTKRKNKKNLVSRDDMQIINSLERIKHDLMFAHMSFDLAEDSALIDSFIFEILSLNKKYEYYLKLCKERGLIAGGV